MRPVKLCLEPPNSNFKLTINTGTFSSASVVIRANGKIVGGVYSHDAEFSVRLWDVQSGKAVADLPGVTF